MKHAEGSKSSMKAVFFIGIGLLMLFLTTQNALAAPSTQFNYTTGSNYEWNSGGTHIYQADTWDANFSGTIDSVQFAYYGHSAACTIQATLWSTHINSTPNAFLCALGTITTPGSAGDKGFVSFGTGKACSVTNGVKYAIVFSSQSATQCWAWNVNYADATGGRYFHGTTNTSVAWKEEASVFGKLAIIGETVVPPASNTTYTVNVKDRYNDTNLAGANVTFYNTTTTLYSVLSDVSGNAVFSTNGTTPASLGWNASKTLYLTTAGAVNANSTATANTSQGVVNVTSITSLITATVLGPALGTWSVNTTLKNYSGGGAAYPTNIYLRDGTNSLTLHYVGGGTYYDKHFQVNISAPQATTTIVSGIYDAVLNVTAYDLFTNATVTNFTVNATNTTFTSSGSTTTGSLLIPLEKNVPVFLEIDGPAYSYANASFTPNASTQNYSFYLYGENSITIYFYDELTEAAITQNVTIEFTDGNTTFEGTYSGGSGYEDLLDPGTWTLTIGSTGYDDRIYFATILSNTHITLNARLLNSSLSADTVFHIIDQDGNFITNATMTMQTSVNGSYVTIAQKVTDFFGIAYFPLVYAETYRVIIQAADYVTKTADFQRVETDYTIRLTANNTQGYVTYGDEFSYTIAPSNVTPTIVNFSISTSSPDGRLEWFSVTTLLNGSYVTTNISGSPSGGTANHILNLTPFNGEYVTAWYRIKSVSFTAPLVIERRFFIYAQNAGNYSLFSFTAHYGDEWSSDADLGTNWKAIISVIIAVLLAAGLGSLVGVEGGAIVGAAVLITFAAAGWLNWSIVIISAGGIILWLAMKGTGGR